MAQKKPITHGGKRTNSGRRATGGNPRILVTLKPIQIETAKRLGSGNQSSGIRIALDMAKNK